MKKIILFIALLVVTNIFILTHLANDNKTYLAEISDLQDKTDSLELKLQEQQSISEQKSERLLELDHMVQSNLNEINRLETLSKTLNLEINSLEKEQPYYYQNMNDYFAVYAGNKTSEYVLPHFYLTMNDDLSLEDKINQLIQVLQDYYFTDMPITLIEIKEVDQKKIAYIDVTDSTTTDKTWSVNYFPGSSGGYITRGTLEETILQRQTNLNEWIDGVSFSFEGKNGYTDSHDPGLFNGIIYRKSD